MLFIGILVWPSVGPQTPDMMMALNPKKFDNLKLFDPVNGLTATDNIRVPTFIIARQGDQIGRFIGLWATF